MNRKAYALTPIAAGLLAACGGGGGDTGSAAPPAAATMVPSSALVSSEAYVQYTMGLSVSSSETAEPLSASNIDVPPASDTTEPDSVS